MGTSTKFLTVVLHAIALLNISAEAASADTSSQSSTVENVKNAVNKLSAQFAKVLLKESPQEANVVFSPFNIYTALGLVHLGATGKTRDELSAILEIPSDDNKLLETHEDLGKLLNDIQNTSSAEIAIANGVFAQKGVNLVDSYLKGSEKYYKSEVRSVDFAKGGNEATDTVNKWISSKTKDRIPKLFAEALSTDTVLLLASALYFNASWFYAFPKGRTGLEKFNTGVKEVQVQMMNAVHMVPYQNNVALQFEAISLPYEHKEFSMIIVLPYANQTIKTLVDTLKPEDYRQLIKDTSSKYVNVDYKIPRFKYKWSNSINKRIIELGAASIFKDAKLGNMITGENYAVSDVTHAAEVEVTEDGTVATAVTVFQFVVRTSLQINFDIPLKFHVNRSFLFVIYHQGTDIILFTGIVNNPA